MVAIGNQEDALNFLLNWNTFLDDFLTKSPPRTQQEIKDAEEFKFTESEILEMIAPDFLKEMRKFVLNVQPALLEYMIEKYFGVEFDAAAQALAGENKEQEKIRYYQLVGELMIAYAQARILEEKKKASLPPTAAAAHSPAAPASTPVATGPSAASVAGPRAAEAALSPAAPVSTPAATGFFAPKDTYTRDHGGERLGDMKKIQGEIEYVKIVLGKLQTIYPEKDRHGIHARVLAAKAAKLEHERDLFPFYRELIEIFKQAAIDNLSSHPFSIFPSKDQIEEKRNKAILAENKEGRARDQALNYACKKYGLFLKKEEGGHRYNRTIVFLLQEAQRNHPEIEGLNKYNLRAALRVVDSRPDFIPDRPRLRGPTGPR